jgi:hypothetical protein
MLWSPLSIHRCTLCATQTTSPATLHHATVSQLRPNNMLRQGEIADRPNRGRYERVVISVHVDLLGYRRSQRFKWIAMARSVNGIKNGIGVSSEDEENTRRGFFGLTKKIRCLAGMRTLLEWTCRRRSQKTRESNSDLEDEQILLVRCEILMSQACNEVFLLCGMETGRSWLCINSKGGSKPGDGQT